MTVVSLVLDSLLLVCLVPVESITVVCPFMASLMLVSLFLGKKMTSFSSLK
jgi:hypothetical protein